MWRIPQMFPFVVTNLTVNFVHGDAINDLQYCRAKMAGMSEMFLKIDINFVFEIITSKNTGYQEKLNRK